MDVVSLRVLSVGVYAALLATLALALPKLYVLPDTPMETIWDYVMGPWLQSGSTKFFAILTVVSACAGILRGYRIASLTLHRLAAFFFAAGIGYLAAYFFSPGYMVLINLKRYVPVLVFLLLPFVALAVWNVLGLIRIALRNPRPLSARAQISISTLVGIHLGMYWIGLQATYLELIPPDQARVLQKLAEPPYSGSTFITNSYAGPVAAKTGAWGYINTLFLQSGKYELHAGGFRPEGKEIYRWFANRDDTKYDLPSYVLCFDMPSFNNAIQVLRIRWWNRDKGLSSKDIYRYGMAPSFSSAPVLRLSFACDGAFSYRKFTASDDSAPRLTMVERDPSLLHRWNIYKLEDDFPPYLNPIGIGPDKAVMLDLRRIGGSCTVKVSYDYHQQQGKPEAGTLMRAWLETQGGRLGVRIYDGPVLSQLRIPAGAGGGLVVSVEPHTRTRRGNPCKAPRCL
jgi:hypothetical protein